MCFVQRHLKRLLAFSTISHVGLFVCGVAMLGSKAIAGAAVYIVAHGLTKGALFMCMGVLLHRFGTVDEFDLHGTRARAAGPRSSRGRGSRAAGGDTAVHRLRGQVADRIRVDQSRLRVADRPVRRGFGRDRRRGAADRRAGVHGVGACRRPGPEPDASCSRTRRRDTRRPRSHADDDDGGAGRAAGRGRAGRVHPGSVRRRAARRRPVHRSRRIRQVGARWRARPMAVRRDQSRRAARACVYAAAVDRRPRSASPRSACSDVRCASRCRDVSASRRARRCASCAICTPARSATTSPGGRPERACSARCACSRSLERGAHASGVSVQTLAQLADRLEHIAARPPRAAPAPRSRR